MATTDPADPAVDEAAFLVALAEHLGLEGPLEGGELLVDDLGLDDLAVLRLWVFLEALAPGFRVPEQFELTDVRTRDLGFYLTSWRSQTASDR